MAVHDKFLSDINRIRALNESFLREDVESRCESISIEEDLFHSEGVSTAQSITSLLSEWQQLDADYLVDFNRVNGTGKRTGLAVPYSFDISQMDGNSSNFAGMNHERIPPELKTEYLTKLTKLLKKVPQEQKSGGTCMLLNSADNTEKFLAHDLHLMPELRPPFERYTTTVKADNTVEISPVSPLSRHTTHPLRETDKEYKEVVISVTVYRADSRLTQPQQCIDVLGSQTLSQLQQAIYCVHNHTHQSGDGANCNNNSSSSGCSHNIDKEAFFCIDGQIYAQLCRPSSSSLRTQSTSCTCHSIETSSATSNSSSASQQSPTNDYIPGAEPVRALMWLYRSLFGIVLPNLTTDTTTTNTSNTTAHSSSSSRSTSGITNAENDNASDADHNDNNNQSNSNGSSSSSAEDTEQIIFVNTSVPTIASTITKPKRSRQPKNPKNTSATDVQPSAEQLGPVTTGSSSVNYNALNTSVVGTGDTLAQAQQPGRGKKRSSTDHSAPSASAVFLASTAQKGRKKHSTITSSSHNITNSIIGTTTKGDNDTFVRLHPYDFNALRTAIASSNSTIEMKCVYNVRLADINFTLGVPYLYVHACGCEHVLYFTNVRSYSHKYDYISPANDTINTQYSPNVAMTTTSTASDVSGGYPVETFRARHKQKRCAVCEVLPAVCVVFEDRLAETNPTLYCEHCYHMLHYAADGQLLYDDFQVFPYTHDP